MGTTTFECPVCCGRVESDAGAEQATCPHCRQPVPTPSLQAAEARAQKALAALDAQHAQVMAKPSVLVGAQMICPHCGSIGRPRTAYRGSGVTTLILFVLAIIVGMPAWLVLGVFFSVPVFLVLFVPTLLYSFWRLTTRHKACRTCRQPGMIPLDTPIGRKIREQVGQ